MLRIWVERESRRIFEEQGSEATILVLGSRRASSIRTTGAARIIESPRTSAQSALSTTPAAPAQSTSCQQHRTIGPFATTSAH
ncbi:uncharacterized protein CELE_T01G5.8 [Caenorhabditis elegans]|uniref:Uncharacterized protein n=1 Tax=Caenorhabditis elegans TaxID=6239 RepID=B1Q271_CAEEL|nr:Uncharacterized protein CELE_T01G5.8 [Caenorhabditis elegans]CAQ16154.1 Uncharacterized protein CELE_T01G5.8 [Caenorhabditis elegans]|eukprot:NP_001122994.1 Uncharacterized protein CELE_T01G5.8 [Caenorhabditis elegans]